MIEVLEAPKSGQFVAMWTYNGKIWSGTYQYINGELYKYDDECDEFKETYDDLCRPNDCMCFFIAN